ncbi:hypothetical protein QWY85_17220 [Neolewinella lacunae]|uniref:Uncharacterized protein n=1 Tax=Neolewinella lacunae TaxID=1517758 RepID=A0A923PR23_9BACT|nr:hypothetical protein [Neolewinella lacunae]MBC6995898.1 hypothetical protein [Neolewinella lacunae]MDN3636410.1 hypothetical protein [Neolewinella lacunae]
MKNAPTPVVIELQQEWFRHAYYVYFVTILDQDRRLVYVGMTGDRKHTMARSPFYRMAGHFNQLTSTENQIIKGIRKHCAIAVGDQAGLVAKLKELKITYHAYPLYEFEFNGSAEDHQKQRQKTEQVESWLMIQLWAERDRDHTGSLKVFNEKISMKPEAEAGRLGALILEDWKTKTLG